MIRFLWPSDPNGKNCYRTKIIVNVGWKSKGIWTEAVVNVFCDAHK